MQERCEDFAGWEAFIAGPEHSPEAVQDITGIPADQFLEVARLVGDTPIYDVMVGDEDGQIPLRRLQRHLMKLPRNLTPKQIDGLENRLAALGSRGGAALPKGPMTDGMMLV